MDKVNLDNFRGVEETNLFLAMVTEGYISNPEVKGMIAYAKALDKPFALAIEEGVDLGNLFDGCNVVGTMRFSRGQEPFEVAKEVNNWILELKKKLELEP
jgi:hypothetical protein